MHDEQEGKPGSASEMNAACNSSNPGPARSNGQFSHRPVWRRVLDRVRVSGRSHASFTIIFPTFFPLKSPMNALTAWSIPDTTVSSFFSFPARK